MKGEAGVGPLRYVDLDAMRQLTLGLTFNLHRCAEVLDHALVGLNRSFQKAVKGPS